MVHLAVLTAAGGFGSKLLVQMSALLPAVITAAAAAAGHLLNGYAV